MSHILNFNNWTRLNESTVSTVPGQTDADLAALDQIQSMADQGPNMRYNGLEYNDANKAAALAAGAETLITSLAGTLNTGRVNKTITFTAMAEKKKWNVKAEFFGNGGKLNAVVWLDGNQVLNGPVVIKQFGGWKQLWSIGDKTASVANPASGTNFDNGNNRDSLPAPVSGGICDILTNNGMAVSSSTLSTPFNPPRKGSNVKFSAKNEALRTFMNTEIAKRAKATPVAPTKA
jgi:hypothetical protein